MTYALFLQSVSKLALVGGMLLDGYEVPPIHHGAVLIEGDQIVRVGRASEISIPPDYELIDTSGRTMLPGLIDLHAHLMILGHGDYARFFAWLEAQDEITLEEVMEISARQLLDAGVTSAVELGAPVAESLRVRDRIDRGEIPGPRMSVSGAWVARRAYSGFPAAAQNQVSSPEQASAVVERLAEAGVDVIKAWARLEQGGLRCDRHHRASVRPPRSRACVRLGIRSQCARSRGRRVAARGLGGNAAIRRRSDARYRCERPSGGADGRASRVGLSGDVAVSGAFAGPAAASRFSALAL